MVERAYNKRLHPTIASVTPCADAQAAPATLAGEANVRLAETYCLNIRGSQVVSRFVELSFRIAFIAITVFVSPAQVFAQCSQDEVLAVFIIDGVKSGEQPSIRDLYVMTHGAETNPSDEEMIDSLGASYLVGTISNIAEFEAFTVFYARPMDFGYAAIVDHRSGGIMYEDPLGWFAGGEDVAFPPGSNYSWNIDESDLAPTPAAIGVAADADWPLGFGEPEVLAQGIIDYVRGSDVVKSIGTCGPYNILCYFSFPAPGGGYPPPYGVVVVNGHCGPPWGGAPVAVEAESWGSIKALYR